MYQTTTIIGPKWTLHRRHLLLLQDNANCSRPTSRLDTCVTRCRQRLSYHSPLTNCSHAHGHLQGYRPSNHPPPSSLLYIALPLSRRRHCVFLSGKTRCGYVGHPLRGRNLLRISQLCPGNSPSDVMLLRGCLRYITVALLARVFIVNTTYSTCTACIFFQ